MTRPNRPSWPRSIALFVFGLAWVLISSVGHAAPAPVRLQASIDSGNWIPIPAEDMKAAAVDAALARISEGGWLVIIDGDAPLTSGVLDIDVTLVAKAQIAKTVMTLDLPEEATYMVTASVSVQGLDAEGFHRAFEHIGSESADRLHALLIARRGGPARSVADGDDERWRSIYNEAQERKHARDYQEARLLFSQVAGSSGRGTERLVQLARDELQYGLPAFEAKQLLVELGSPARNGNLEATLSRAEDLYRQIQAENATHLARQQECQQMLDQIAVMRSAIAQAARSQAYMRVSQARMQLTELFLMEGRCPDEESARRTLTNGPFEIELTHVRADDAGGYDYDLTDLESGTPVPVSCDPRTGIRFDMGGASR